MFITVLYLGCSRVSRLFQLQRTVRQMVPVLCRQEPFLCKRILTWGQVFHHYSYFPISVHFLSLSCFSSFIFVHHFNFFFFSFSPFPPGCLFSSYSSSLFLPFTIFPLISYTSPHTRAHTCTNTHTRTTILCRSMHPI